MVGLERLSLDIDAAGIARVVLDRPPANALDLVAITELGRVAEILAAEDRVRVVVVSSALDGFFCAGADLAMLATDWGTVGVVGRRLQEVYLAWERLPRPTVGVLDGHALGGGFEFALALDLRVMSRGRARLGLPESLRGLLPSGGGTQRLGRIVGRARALDLLLRGRLLDADEAFALGLVTEVAEPAELAATVDALVAELAALSPLALAAVKTCVLDGLDTDLAGGMAIEAATMDRLALTEDAQEGVRSFIEKRAPVFRGR